MNIYQSMQPTKHFLDFCQILYSIKIFGFINKQKCFSSFSVQNGKTKDTPKPLNEDIIQKSIGVMGKWHLWVCFIIFLVKFPVAWHQLSIVFLAPPVDFSCYGNVTDACANNCTTYIYDT